MHTATRRLVALAAASFLVLAACGGDDEDVTETGEPPATTSTTVAETTTTGAPAATTTTVPAGVEQPAIWPAADVVFATPEEAAEDFVTVVLGVPATLGEFQQGDARSGEIEVFSPGEGGGATIVRGVLRLLRQLGPDDGWFVLSALNENAAFTVPDSGAEVPAGPLAVEGVGRGFEANVVLTARVAGATTDLDQVISSGGAFEEPEPFAESLDLSGAAPGDVVLLLVRGGTGLETDPGDFGTIPVVIAG